MEALILGPGGEHIGTCSHWIALQILLRAVYDSCPRIGEGREGCHIYLTEGEDNCIFVWCLDSCYESVILISKAIFALKSQK